MNDATVLIKTICLKNILVIFFKYFEIYVSEDKKTSTINYRLPKLFNSPTEAKFIIAALTCSVKLLFKFITCVLD